MNRYTKILTVVFSACLLFACNKELDLPSDGRITMDQVFSDYNRTRGYLNSCYGHCPPPGMNRAGYTDEAQHSEDVRADSKYANWYGGNVTAATYDTVSADGGPWGMLYEGIRKCNVFIENIKTATVLASEEEKAAWTAQAHTLRALYYLQLIKRYGG
ncbi:MAG TPA: RagB/SusD family nutrient uptake outer membrane protein, partial [Anseongella sp.]|nr:RagB/SusD family nutrient uptake outer membrane protein [Anseongella sp.]